METLLWAVDAQVDFMLPGGKLYVPSAERIISNVNRLAETARQKQTLLISSADAHNPDDPEFRDWPPHCLKGTPGAELVPEARAGSQLVIPNQKDFLLPRDLGNFEQIILEKNTLDVFDNPNAEQLLARLSSGTPKADASPEFLVFGVVTEYCVRLAAAGLLRRGFHVNLIEDAIQSLDDKKGSEILRDLQSQGARLITTEEALGLVGHKPVGATESEHKRAAGI